MLSTRALPGVRPEARVWIRYRQRRGHYPDGTPFTLRVPEYVITDLGYGPLAPHTLIEPRLAPSLYGVGLLEEVPVKEIVDPPPVSMPAASSFGTFAIRWRAGRTRVGRFGWQGTSVSVRDQTTKALERDMGVTSLEYPAKDCTSAELACRSYFAGGTPEIASRLVDALVAYERSLPRPQARASVDLAPPDPTFMRLGCAACHRPRLPVVVACGRGSPRRSWVAPYSDLRLHFLGTALDDRDAAGRPAFTRLRTAPLWNLGHLRVTGQTPTLLHDGRARSIEEAILWHAGEARAARRRFLRLPRAERRPLLKWLAGLGAPEHRTKEERAPPENPGLDAPTGCAGHR
ncbi:MAG TPA: di-heme oxidoredictase family protein [Steroidobacteraceae bacterium]|nr:di-heme oxidoredictase family protein [Steroidobacteraceae bacterium]